MNMMCYNLGEINAHTNGNEVQLSFNREEEDPEWTRGETYIKHNGTTDVLGFFYTLLSPEDARRLAEQLIYLADKTEEMYENDPIYIALKDGIPMYDSDSEEYFIYFSEKDAEDGIKELEEYDNEGHNYSYRPLTCGEHWKWHKENVIE